MSDEQLTEAQMFQVRAIVRAELQRLLSGRMWPEPALPDKPAQPAPMTMHVSANDVQRALRCSRASAYAYMREAVGKPEARGLARIPLDVWEAYAKERFGPKPAPAKPGKAPAPKEHPIKPTKARKPRTKA